MKPITLLQTAILPATAELLRYGIPPNAHAHRLMLTIALQESGLRYRRQVVSGGIENGPAASFWQFEQGGGVKGVLNHPATLATMRCILADFNVGQNTQAMWEAMRYQDIVAACAARLLIYTLPGALPQTAADGWDQYVAAWRPGKPHRDTWDAYWKLAGETVGVV